MFDLIIIGGGVAGMTSALYSLRNNKTVLILEKETYGGQIAKSPKVENYPTKKSISGSQLADELFEQICDLSVAFELEDVIDLVKFNNVFTVKTNYNTYQAKSVIIACGVKPRMLNLANEQKFLGKGVFYCAICDGPFYKDKNVTLIGDANSAMQYAILLAGYCKKVSLITLFDRFFCEKTLEEQVRNTKNIEITHNLKATELIGDNKLTAIKFENLDKNTIIMNTDALFVAIGQVPNNKCFDKLVDLDKSGFIISGEGCTTKTEGLFVAGDCRTKEVRQLTTAISDGAIAATKACAYINALK